MKKVLSVLITAGALAAGCGNSGDDFVATGGSGAGGTTIPVAGGQVALPRQDGFSGVMTFDPGSAPGNEIRVSGSLAAPSGATLPLVGLTSPQATTRPFYYLTFTVAQPTPVSLLESVRLSGPVPEGHEHYHADLFALGDGSTLGQGASATHLQEIPGEADAEGVTFDEVSDGGTLQPGVPYVMRFKSTDQETLDLKIVNNSGQSPCYIFIKGENPNLDAGDRRFYRVTPQGQFVPMDVDDLRDGVADYNIPVPAEGLTMKLPLMSSGRVYVSVGEKIKTQLNKPVLPTDPPALWVAPSGWSNKDEPNFKTLWDWVEYDYKISPDSGLPGMGINKTEVQMVALPFTISMTGSTTGTQTVGAKEGARSALFGEIAADLDFKGLIVPGTATGTTVSPIRVVSPDNGIYNVKNNIPGVPTFPLDYYDSYIDQVWEKYRDEDLTMVTSAFGTFVGRVNAQDQLVFRQDGQRSVTIPKPTSADVIIGNGALIADVANAAPGREQDIVREHASTLSANFNRSTLLISSTMYRTYAPGIFDPATFYANLPTNLYSKLIHAHSLPTEKAPYGAAYGFGFDDNLDQSSFIADNRAPDEVTITITEF